MQRSVLIVDDIPFVRKTLSQILTEAHYTVVGEAADGPSAVDMFRRHHPDLVLMDIVMPGLSGIEAARKILEIDKQARIIMVTAMGQETLLMDSIAVGAKNYIMKPFQPQQILKAVEHVFAVEENEGR